MALLALMVVSLYYFGPQTPRKKVSVNHSLETMTVDRLPCGTTIDLNGDGIKEHGQLCPSGSFCQQGNCLQLSSDYCLHHQGAVTLTDGSQEGVFCANSLMWSPTNADGLSWSRAQRYCADLQYAGFTDWRLPSRTELTEVFGQISCKNCVHWDSYCCHSSAEKYPDNYWTGTVYKEPYAWYVTCSNGIYRNYYKDHLYSVRCVRG